MCRKKRVWSRGVMLRLAPHRVGGEVGHAHPPGQRLQPRLTDRVEDELGVVVVGDADHRPEHRSVARGERPVAHRRAVQVGDQQHRLDHAGRPLVVIGAVAVEAVRGPHRERDVAHAGVRVGDRRRHVGAPELVDGPARCPGPRTGPRRARRGAGAAAPPARGAPRRRHATASQSTAAIATHSAARTRSLRRPAHARNPRALARAMQSATSATAGSRAAGAGRLGRAMSADRGTRAGGSPS